MLRAKLLLILLSGALIFGACSESGTDPDDPNDPDNGDEPIEPTASVNNPEDDAMLDGEITFSINGEAENGFSEARIFVGDEQIETVESPEMPYEQTITTYNYDNGDYDLRAELDVAEQDTSIEASVSATFENYMVTLETDGYIEQLSANNDAVHLFIADSDGNVLSAEELTAYSDGTIQLLPPESLGSGVPESYSVTIGRENDGNLALSTDFMLSEMWTTLHLSGNGSGTASSKEITVKMDNVRENADYTAFRTNEDDRNQAESSGDMLETTFSYSNQSSDLMIVHFGNPYQDENAPLYIWEDQLGDLDDSDILEYDVSSDFKQMTTHNVAHSPDVTFGSYRYEMSVASDSWDEGYFAFPSFWQSGYDANESDTEIGMFVPEEGQLFRSYLTVDHSSENNIWYERRITGDLPTDIEVLDPQLQVTTTTMDDFAFEKTGSSGATSNFWTIATTADGKHSWSAYMPNLDEESSSFTFPKIADSLDQSTSNFDRSDFNFLYFTADNYENVDSYEDYEYIKYGSSEESLGDYHFKWWYLAGDTQQKQLQKKANRISKYKSSK